MRKALDAKWIDHPLNTTGESLMNLGAKGLDLNGREGADALSGLLAHVSTLSVDTSHPMFFNQLYGTMDPAALASELSATFENTSNYTYEAAPAYSMMEHEVLRAFTGLLGETWKYGEDSEGLIVPGGSLGNLYSLHLARHHYFPKVKELGNSCMGDCVAFVSEEAHYSFLKTIGVLGLGRANLIKIKNAGKGGMDVAELEKAILKAKAENKRPWYIGTTAGSTVRGTYDPFNKVADIANKYDCWMHVDGAWGGAALFSERPEIKDLCKGIERCDSMTINPHKMLGAPLQVTVLLCHHKGLLISTNSSEAGYLFDKRKQGAELDVGDGTFMCGRRNDAVKVWGMWKYRGQKGFQSRVDHAAGALDMFAAKIRKNDNFMLACETWPFNLNFFYLPKRFRKMLEDRGIPTDGSVYDLPADISAEINNVAIILKKRLQDAGVAMLPYQPLSNQTAQVFRVVLAGCRDDWGEKEIDVLMANLVKYGDDL